MLRTSPLKTISSVCNCKQHSSFVEISIGVVRLKLLTYSKRSGMFAKSAVRLPLWALSCNRFLPLLSWITFSLRSRSLAQSEVREVQCLDFLKSARSVGERVLRIFKVDCCKTCFISESWNLIRHYPENYYLPTCIRVKNLCWGNHLSPL